MKLYDSIGPNPRLVRLFLAEKGVAPDDRVRVDIMAGENRQADYRAKNPGEQLPALELDDGRVLAETIAICEYVEELHPDPPLIGRSPEERGESRMWTRRVEQRIVFPMTDAFRYSEGLPLFQTRMHVIPQAADDLKQIAREGMVWLEAQLDAEFVTGDALRLPDVVLFAFLEFGNGVGQPLDPGLPKLNAWFERMAARDAVAASA